MKTSDFYQLKRVYKYSGCYVFWDIGNNPLYVGYARKTKLGTRISSHYQYLQPLIHSISIYPTKEYQLLEYTLIQRLNPKYNKLRNWNQVTQSRYGSIPYLLPENSYWGHKFYKKGYFPFKWNSEEDKQYFRGLEMLIEELES